jgi:hypothetical protein
MVGVNGSMSRFAIVDNYLYVVTIQNGAGFLKTIDIANEQANTVNTLNISSAVETLFAYGEHLFLGLSNGMMIYSIKNPSMPVFMSNTWHFWGCDPVVVSGDYAYLTIRSTNTCGQNGNLLQVIDISTITEPKVVSQFNMQEPYGLGVDENKLFICDKGLKVYDATEPLQVGNKMLFSTTEFKGFDLIPYKNLLLVIGGDGLYQYSYSSDNQLKRLSVIPVSK